MVKNVMVTTGIVTTDMVKTVIPAQAGIQVF